MTIKAASSGIFPPSRTQSRRAGAPSRVWGKNIQRSARGNPDGGFRERLLRQCRFLVSAVGRRGVRPPQAHGMSDVVRSHEGHTAFKEAVARLLECPVDELFPPETAKGATHSGSALPNQERKMAVDATTESFWKHSRRRGPEGVLA